jgi:two-component sensor histidine kinase
MLKPLISIVLFFICTTFFSQSHPQKNIIDKIERFIIEDNIDSAKHYLSKVEDTDYKKVLQKIINKEKVTYTSYQSFFANASNNYTLDYAIVSNFLDQTVKPPKQDVFNKQYYNIKWEQIYKLRDDVSVQKASAKQKELEAYLEKFNPENIEVQKAVLKLKTHQIVLYNIEQNVKEGKKLVLESLEKAKQLKDKQLQITFLYHLSDFLILENKLQEYIDVSEESLRLENELPQKTPYYYATVQHLIDAYIFKGGFNDRVNTLINELYNNPQTKIQTYSLYLKLIAYSKPNSNLTKDILQKFSVNTLPELVAKFEKLGKPLNPNDFFYILKEGSNALATNNFFKEALNYKDKSIVLTRKIYAEDLSNSLADFKTAQAIKEKEKEIDYEKERTKLYGLIAVLTIISFLIALLVLRKVKKQSKQLSEKNRLINKTLKEKELLVKEVHHRVKNNFQIVSSLLELQSRGIEDEKAKELANEGKNRVKSMALIHQKLYENESGLVDFDEYIQQLTKELSSLYATKNSVETKVSSKDIKFDVDTAIPLGLIINEIITNSYKYAFTNNAGSKLSVAINKEENDNYKLVIEDNGPGLSKDFDVKKAKSLGLRLVNRLVKQLHGQLKQTNNSGAKFEIYFKDTNARRFVN